jgi:phytoene dehydrogenase-like protein
MPKKSIIIIGAGIAGLSAGCYAQMNSYKTKIFEMHDKPGGLCTSWKRKGYTIDGCIHYLLGSRPGTIFYRVWEELGAVQGKRMIDQDEFMRIDGKDGKTFIAYNDLDSLEQHMKELAPEDSDAIEEFIEGARIFTQYDLPFEKATELLSPIDRMKESPLLPFALAVRKWTETSIRDFAKRLKNPFLREAFLQFQVVYRSFELPVLFRQLAIAYGHMKSAGFPVGGSLEFARSIERRYLGLGGNISYRSRVSKILVKNGHAIGIRLEDDTEHFADYVLSAADGHSTIFDMLEGKYINKEIRGYYDKLPLSLTPVHVSLGVASSFKNLPHRINYPLEKPITITGIKHERLQFFIYNFDPTLAPEGKTVVKVIFPSDYGYWKKLKKNPKHYKAEKKKIADTVVRLLDERFPGFAEKVEMRDVATPLTYERYTGNWKGSTFGWRITTDTFKLHICWQHVSVLPHYLPKTLPGLRNFYMAGQWLDPGGGLPVVAISGRNAIQLICNKDRKKFVTTTPV